MKKHFYFLCAISSLFTVHSCTNDVSEDFTSQKKIKLTQNEVFSISYDETEDLKETTLFDMVNAFANLQNETTTRSNVTSFKIVKESFINKEGEFEEQEQATRAIKNDDITSKICEIEFTNGSSIGRAVVSANANFPAIIAFIPKCSSEKIMEQTGASKLLHASKASYLYNTIKMKEAVDSLRLPTLEKISKELEIPINEVSYEKVKNYITITDAEPTTRSTAVQIGDIKMQIYNDKSIFPLVKTNWGQEDPYNGWFSNIDRDGLRDWVRTQDGGKNFTSVPAGCVNIAMAQMMTYTHRNRIPQIAFPIPKGKYEMETGMTFIPNWDQMTKTPKLDDPGAGGLIDAQYLILDLYIENKTKSKKDWDNAVIASEVSEQDMLNTMNKYFKYQSKAKFNGDMAWAALRDKHLVLMLTSDHAFIISGILVTEKAIATRELVKRNDVYWHANFGWANECTGFYQLNSDANTHFNANGIEQWSQQMDYLNNIYAK
ncbi:C10 family peptidase [Bacteroides caecimuris]|uniref:C10 family peptidase n=1 Tax=Bacteroides caecimuris TaxID=1796613 RepID=UPI001C3DE844|nr:C10 family peptidase [Bacteroides caecimuris]